MPRIRKKTSKRTGTNDRAKLKHKIKEGKKKLKKQAKKNPQWKSRVKKDPGIPSSVPFKDQIIAEVQQSRRDEEAERDRKRQLQKPAVLRKEDPKTMSGISTITNSGARTVQRHADGESDDEMDNNKAPLLIDRSLPNLKVALHIVNVVLYVLDARDPLAHRVPSLEKLVQEQRKNLVFLLHKVDLVPRESVEQWLIYLRNLHPTFPFRSASSFLPPPDGDSHKGKQKVSLKDSLGQAAVLEYLNHISEAGTTEPLRVAIVGHTNVGKSSIVNSLLQSSLLPIYKPTAKSTSSAPNTTLHPHAIGDKLKTENGRAIQIIDTPGLSLISPSDQNVTDVATKDMLLRRHGKLERVTDPMPAATHVVSRANTQDLMVRYNIPAFLPGDVIAFLTCLARSTGRLKKKGIPDLKDSASSLLRDWRVGKFPYVTSPPKSNGAGMGVDENIILKEIYKQSDKITLERLQDVKEMRTGKGLIRFKIGDVDERDVDLEYVFEDVKSSKKAKATEEDGDSSGRTNEEDEEEVSSEVESGDNDGDQDQSDSPPPRPIPTLKRKRISKGPPQTLPSKKVAFAKKPLGKTSSSSQKITATIKPAMNDKTIPSPKPNTSKPPKSKSSRTLSSSKVDLVDQPYDFSAHFRS